MDQRQMENVALGIIEQNKGKIFVCQDRKDPSVYGMRGLVDVLEDMNCCCPTDQVLFAFLYGEDPDMPRRKVMAAEDFLAFFQTLRPLD